ncbi:protein of unknown function [Caballeronia sp. S22]
MTRTSPIPDDQSVNYVPDESVNHVPGLYTAAKKVGKESSYPQPKHFMPAAAQAIGLMARQ